MHEIQFRIFVSAIILLREKFQLLIKSVYSFKTRRRKLRYLIQINQDYMDITITITRYLSANSYKYIISRSYEGTIKKYNCCPCQIKARLKIKFY